ncbi:MAG TPA: HAD-IC family P-type ATPase [Streptosporangiaceae bacterium]
MFAQAGAVLSAIAQRIPLSAGRPQRRRWMGNGRAHIEVKGVHRPENAPAARQVEAELSGRDGVDWARVNDIAGRVIVAFDDQQVSVDDLVDIIEGVEEAHDLADERFPHDRPDHPGDSEPVQRQIYAIGADIGGLGLGLAGQLTFGQFGGLARRNPLVGEVASLLSLVDSSPLLRRPLEGRIGRAATDLGLAIGNAVAQGLVQGPLGLLVDIAHRGLLLDELRARRDLWQEHERMLYGNVPAHLPPTMTIAERPVPLPAGPVETYSNTLAAAGIAGGAATALITRDVRLMVAATAAAAPRAAKLGREGFAARVDRDLARSGVLAMDMDVLRRLDRVDTVVLDAQLLTTGRMVVGTVRVLPGHEPEAEAALLAAHALVGQSSAGQQGASVPGQRAGADPPDPPVRPDPPERPDPPDDLPGPQAVEVTTAIPRARASSNGTRPPVSPRAASRSRAAAMAVHPSADRRRPSPDAGRGAGPAAQVRGHQPPAILAERGEWAIGPVPARLAGPAGDAAGSLRERWGQVLGLRRNGELLGLVAVEPELEPMAGPLIATARSIGPVVIAGLSGVGRRVHVDRVVAGGTRTAGSVRALQADGAVVALVSARQHEALAAADLGIGVAAGPPRPPWGADLVTGPGLADACRILQAVPPARSASKRAALLAAYGSSAGAVLALAGPRSTAASRSLLAVNGAALAALGSGVWSAMTLARRPAPLPAETTDWHALDSDVVLARLASTAAGLDPAEAARRRAERPADGEAPAEPGVVRASLEQLANPLTPVLASGAGLAALAGSITDAALIGTCMAANALVSGVQRVSVGHALRRLIDESAVRVRLRRARGEELTTADQLVAGDVIIVVAGDAVPADCRIIEARGLEVDESSLTGESQLVAKNASPTGAVNVAERRSMLYAGSSIAAGTGTAVVVATGPATELGRSEQATGAEERAGGVEARLRQLTRTTVPITLGAGAAVIAGGLLRGRPLRDTLGTGVSLAVAAVPEGLPIVASAAQYSAARRLSRRNALVRNPGTIEAMGRVDVLCFDKTGTLTQGRIRLHRVWAAGQAGTERPLTDLRSKGRHVLAAGLRATPEHREGEALAHATDRAVVEGGREAGVSVELGVGRWRQTGELPFEPSRGYHAVLGRTPAGQRLAVKGAPETVLPLCDQRQRGSRTVELDRRGRRAIEKEAERLARNGYRVLAVAEREASSRRDLHEDRISRLCFTGLLALADPVRDTAAQAISGLRAAKVEVMMLTGDHPSTAEAIAAELDLLDGRGVVTGPELDELTDPELDQLVTKAAVFARVSPDHKVRIVAALRRIGRVVAVTGDGANDAPAIRLADVGVALGRRGTNAAREAADVVVTDDRIETIIDAITEGRAMWSSVRDAIAMLLGGNLGEIAFTIGTGLLAPGGSPLNARQLLLVNLFTDLVPSLALAVREPDTATPEMLLREGPEASLGAALNRDIVIRGGLTAGAGLAAWAGGRMTGITPRRASTTALVGIVGAQLGQTLVTGWRSPLVVAASVGSAAALAGVIQTPGVSQFFGCTPLGPVGWGIGMSAATAASIGAPLVSGLVPA